MEFEKINNNILLINKEGKYIENNEIKNYIIAEIDIKENNQYVRIINSYEELIRENLFIDYKKEYDNEKEIKNNCEIRINDNKIKFCYFYEFKEKGKYNIKYIFKNDINNCNYIYYECTSLTNIDLSNFNTNNITNMSNMFSGCASLTDINLSNFNTNNVTNMSGMFMGCSSLTSINLSNFNTNRVTNMALMFYGCAKLKKENVITNDEKLLNNFK